MQIELLYCIKIFMEPHIVWFREDLRLRDNPALSLGTSSGRPLIFVYLFTPEEEKPWEPGEGSRFWLYHSLADLDKEIKKLGGKIHFFRGKKSLTVLNELIKESGATSLSFNLSMHPALLKRDRFIFQELQKKGIAISVFYGNLLLDPKEILEVHNKPYKVFTPFYKCLEKCGIDKPLSKPKKFSFYSKKISAVPLGDLKILPTTNWVKDLATYWKPGCSKTPSKIDSFSKKVSSYKKDRDFPAIDGTSKFSAPLHFGEVSPKELWQKYHSFEAFRREIAWREFAQHLLLYFPETTTNPLKEEFEKFPWKKDSSLLRKWKEGKTGYPYIDAGMRQLSSIGWMHNRVRMAVASFLVKDLHLHWLEGAKWFWEKLVDADLASNTLNWQWSAGCGADAAPFFRIFNPVTQGKKFDPDGEYVKSFVPELAKLPKKYIHEPWAASDEVLDEAGIVLGKNYPKPIVDHDQKRKKSLEIFHTLIKK